MRACVIDERQLSNDRPKIHKYFRKIQRCYGVVLCCYEAPSCGFGLQRALKAQGVSCEVIAPSYIPRRSGERVKTDRRDAKELATLYAAGLLMPVCMPEEEQEAARSLPRCRADLVKSTTQSKQRILSFLQVRGFRFTGGSNWTKGFSHMDPYPNDDGYGMVPDLVGLFFQDRLGMGPRYDFGTHYSRAFRSFGRCAAQGSLHNRRSVSSTATATHR